LYVCVYVYRVGVLCFLLLKLRERSLIKYCTHTHTYTHRHTHLWWTAHPVFVIHSSVLWIRLVQCHTQTHTTHTHTQHTHTHNTQTHTTHKHTQHTHTHNTHTHTTHRHTHTTQKQAKCWEMSDNFSLIGEIHIIPNPDNMRDFVVRKLIIILLLIICGVFFTLLWISCTWTLNTTAVHFCQCDRYVFFMLVLYWHMWSLAAVWLSVIPKSYYL